MVTFRIIFQRKKYNDVFDLLKWLKRKTKRLKMKSMKIKFGLRELPKKSIMLNWLLFVIPTQGKYCRGYDFTIRENIQAKIFWWRRQSEFGICSRRSWPGICAGLVTNSVTVHVATNVFSNANRLFRVVQTKAILFLKSMSERVGSDIERLWIWIFSRFLVDLEINHSISESLYVGSASFRQWFRN